MLITPIISGGIPEIPVINSGQCLGPIIIPFTHHPSKVSSDKIWIRIIFPNSNKYEYSLSPIESPLIFKLAQANDKNEVYKFDNIESRTKVETSFTITADDVADIDNESIKFQLSYDNQNWSPAVTAKCIPDIFNRNNDGVISEINSDYFSVTDTPLGLNFTYKMPNITKLKKLEMQTYYLENEKYCLETNKILNIQQKITQEQQIAFQKLKKIVDSSSPGEWWCQVFGTTMGGYNFSANIKLTRWSKQTTTTFSLSIDSHGIRISKPSDVAADIEIGAYATLCHRKVSDKFWKPLTYHTSIQTYIDTQVENGIEYEYAYLSNSNSSNSAEAVSLMSDYGYIAFSTTATNNNTIVGPFIEDMYLQEIVTDEENQQQDTKTLYIKYNPQISSFKRVIQEQKIETIGNQYPIFIRNGHINYHEFSIGGLISYLMDPMLYNNSKDTIPYRTEFYTWTEWDSKLQKDDTNNPIAHPYFNSTDLTPNNIETETMFRTDVLQWLTNGKDKEFYSPTEGRMKVRLTNVQLTPETKLGRMIYSFTAQATEVGEIE